MNKRSLLMTFVLLASVAGRARAASEDHPMLPEPFEAQRVLAAAADSISFAARVYNVNKVGLTLTNYGFVGTNFSSFAPSFEYPLGSSHMHMVRGGPWVGAISADENGAFVGVTVAAEDGSAGANSAGSSEYTPAGTYVGARSTLLNSRFFDPGAVSELDYISSYSDEPANPRHKHRPLNILVTQYDFGWSFSDYAHFVIFHYVIKNNGPPLRNVWFGMYDELASGNMRLQSQLPPTGWFSKKLISWVDSLSMFTERYCQSRPFPAQCRFDLVPEIVGVKLLGVHPGNAFDTTSKRVTFQSWTYAPGDPSRDVDSLKYQLMSSGLKTNLNPLPDSLAPGTGDPVSLIAVGPFTAINPGDSVSVDFAYIGGLTQADLAKRGRLAQRAYELDYLVPVPPPSPKFKVVVRDHALDYYWDHSPESFIDPTNPIGRDFEGYRVYVGENRDTLNLLAQFDLAAPPHDTTGFNTGFAAIQLPVPVVIDGVTYQYKYTVDNLRDGFKYFSAVTAYDLGTPDIESLEGGISQNEVMAVPASAPGEHPNGVTVYPNPYRVEAAWDRGQQARDHYLWFGNLPQQCKIRIYTLSGDLIFESDFDGKTYNGSNARGIYQPGTDIAPTLSGATFGWDMITRGGQAAATGLYIWSVEDKNGGKRQTGKLLLVKSDRESF
jgi:hypothetical protein